MAMVEKQSAGNNESPRHEAGREAEKAASVEHAASTEHALKSTPPDSPSNPVAAAKRRPAWQRRLLIGAAGVLVLAALLVFGVPRLRLALNTVSTDDAYVNGHVTFVAPRVSGQIARVLVDDNNRVRKGELLAQLDKEPFEDAVAVKKAAVDTAKANLQVAVANVRGVEAQARSQFWQLQNAIEDVDNRVAQLRSRSCRRRSGSARK